MLSADSQTDQGTDEGTLIDLLTNRGPAVAIWDDVVAGQRQAARGTGSLQGPSRTLGEFGDRPDQPRHARLLYGEVLPDGEARPVESDEAGHRSGPFGPVLDVA